MKGPSLLYSSRLIVYISFFRHGISEAVEHQQSSNAGGLLKICGWLVSALPSWDVNGG